MKKLLIISPYFPPSNAADMQRVRMSLPYYNKFEWEVEVVCVDEQYYEGIKDYQLLNTIPNQAIIHKVSAFAKHWTRQFGLGSLAIRSLWFYRKKVNSLLTLNTYDLIYFSTTQFPVCILGAYWKKKFGIPYVIDMQDPWHSNYYKDKPKAQQPKKYWFSYRLNKYLERIAMKSCDGLIAVSERYIIDLKQRYQNIKTVPNKVITFGYSDIDYTIASSLFNEKNTADKLDLSYIGVLGPMMNASLRIFFSTCANIPNFQNQFRVSLYGTSYIAGDKFKKTNAFANEFALSNINEQPQRLGMLAAISAMQKSDGLVIFGTDDPGYTASKIYPYIQSKKPILAILHPESSAFNILKKNTSAMVISINDSEGEQLRQINVFLTAVKGKQILTVNQQEFNKYSAEQLTKKQCTLFDHVINS